MATEKLPEFKDEEEKRRFFEATKFVENKQGVNPENKYQSGFIQGFNKRATEGGEYKFHTDEVIKKTKEELGEIYEEMEKNKNATFKLSEEHTDPIGYKERKLKEEEEENKE